MNIVWNGKGFTWKNRSGRMWELKADKGNNKSLRWDKSLNVTFVNKHTKPVNITWLDYKGKEVTYKKHLEVNGEFKQQTYSTHPWIISDSNDPSKVLMK